MEVLKRKIKTEKIINTDNEDMKMQVSLNSDNHLVIRFYNPEDQNDDVVIVFTSAQTNMIKNFIKYRI